MKFTISWLKDYLDTTADLSAIVDRLNMLGLEVEGIDNPGEHLREFTACLVKSAEAHPDADRLKVCQLETVMGEFQVVCGAPNARAGMKGVFAPPGSYIPGSDMVLKPAKIRGVQSSGMLLSERETGISDDHDQIIELAADTETGTSFAVISGLDDPVIEVAITPNRGDCFSVYGIARDLAASGIGDLRKYDFPSFSGQCESPIQVKRDFSAADADSCPMIACCLIRGIANRQSPDWLIRRLRAIGLRPINALVDITNYLTFDIGRPLHVYDADKLSGDIEVRLGRQGEGFVALNGNEYDITPHMCVIADASGAIGLGGVIGGESTSCDDDTTAVVIESALFDPVRTAKTSRAIKVSSDAGQRFERHVDPNMVLPGLAKAAQLITDICGGETSEAVVAGAAVDDDIMIDFPLTEVKRLTGYDASAAEIKASLKALGFWLTGGGDVLKVAPPSFRSDISDKADLVEEVIRILGIDLIEPRQLPYAERLENNGVELKERICHKARFMLAARGFVEAVNWSFITNDQARQFGGGDERLRLDNPISVDMSDMRPSLLPGLIAAVSRNSARGISDLALCEVGQVFLAKDNKQIQQKSSICGVRSGCNRPNASHADWRNGAGQIDVFDIKADVMALLAAFGLPISNMQTRTTDLPSWFHPGRSGLITLGPVKVMAAFGEIHPLIADRFGVSVKMAGFEIIADDLPLKARPDFKAACQPLVSDLPYVSRDFAFIINDTISVDKLVGVVRRANQRIIDEVTVFDVYKGANMACDERSLAISVSMRPGDHTMTSAEIDKVSDDIIAAATKIGARLRDG